MKFDYIGKLTVYTSQSTDHPYVGNAEFDCIFFNLIFLSFAELKYREPLSYQEISIILGCSDQK